ncbi:mannitol-1-phosphate 5-dehydrogenase [Clostridium sp. Cult2]|uniref:mannitol-1-phosphate 5-dehydrogenase n=1 Tax=Clostridium sp. Cult2 TaxID=2079003 RepID=UPI001F31CFB5|nr:mannitol-1-phosphate 5-dehydrogenase [Clostridium sp. Cult2]MCF6464947.1 mannitol-1-phosphate 5-dehydrogenase [Clostridium sp. Cult2]
MLAIHFGGGNIGRGFIGEVLHDNHFEIAFVDINEEVIDALNEFNEYIIELAVKDKRKIKVDNVYGINNKRNPDRVVEAFAKADLVTTAIGPSGLPYIAPLIAKGIQKRRKISKLEPIDIIVCENMIDGGTALKSKVVKYLSEEELLYAEEYIGFPNCVVDRIVPLQVHEDKLFVSVDPYREWIIDETGLKNKHSQLKGVRYVSNLEPFIERKLFTANTGHAATAYIGKYEGHETIAEALVDDKVNGQVIKVLNETGMLLVEKWNFNREEHEEYIKKVLSRFMNPCISDNISRVARAPIRKLGYKERFIQPIRETEERNISNEALIQTVGKILVYKDPNDEESQKLSRLLKQWPIEEVIREVTCLTNQVLIDKIAEEYRKL